MNLRTLVLSAAPVFLATGLARANPNPEPPQELAPSAPAVVSPLTVTPDRANATYHCGEIVTFAVSLQPSDGESTVPDHVDWILSKDGLPPLKKGTVPLKDGKATITGSLDKPGFLQCKVTVPEARSLNPGEKPLSTLSGVAVDPLQIKPSMSAPDDFQAFWDEQKKKLAAVPFNAQLTPLPASPSGLKVFEVRIDSVGKIPVMGYFALPATAAPKSSPAIVLFQGAGVTPARPSIVEDWARRGFLALQVNAHGLPNDKPTAYYQELKANAYRNYAHWGRRSRETSYFLGMFLRALRAVQFCAAQPQWDGHNLIAFGSSQGGAQSIAATSLEPRVSFFVAGVPAMCDHTGYTVGQPCGWPQWGLRDESGEPVPADPAVENAARYYDSVNFVRGIKVPGFFSCGFIDHTCPPTTVYAAYNTLASPKQMFDQIGAGHTNTPASEKAMLRAVLQDVKRTR